MPQTTQSPDPYRQFKFRLVWEGRCVAGVSKVSGLARTTEVVTHRAGGDPTTPRRAPGQTEYGAITLERGVTHDAAIVAWADSVWRDGQPVGSGGRLARERPELLASRWRTSGRTSRWSSTPRPARR